MAIYLAGIKLDGDRVWVGTFVEDGDCEKLFGLVKLVPNAGMSGRGMAGRGNAGERVVT